MDAESRESSAELLAEEFEAAAKLLWDVLDPHEIDRMQPLGPAAVYSTAVTTWLMILQRMRAGCSLSKVVSELLSKGLQMLPDNRRVREGRLSSNTGAYSRARTRLPHEALDWLADKVYSSFVETTPPTWNGRRAFLLDGTTISLVSPTPELLSAFPPSSNQHGDGIWPTMLMLVAHELSSGCAISPEIGPMYGSKSSGEVALAKQVLPRLPQQSLIVADCNFGIFGFAFPAVATGHDVVLRLTKSRFESLLKRAELIQDGTHRRWKLDWTPTRDDRRTHPELPPDAKISVWLHEFPVPKEQLMIVTTLDEDTQAIADLYRHRGNVETDIRDVKVALKTEEIRAKNIDMLKKELSASMIAYNIVVQIRRLAAKKANVKPRRLSFTGTWDTVMHMLFAPRSETAVEWQRRFDQTLRMAGQRKVPNRPGRKYPREAYPRRKKFTGKRSRGQPPNPK
jgi:Transposase DDE domain